MGLFSEKMMAISFSSDPRCLLKISRARSQRELTLTDGTRVRPGEIVVGAHLWNAHLPERGQIGLSSHLAQLSGSLRQLARHLQSDSDLSDARAVYGDVGFIPARAFGQAQRYAGRLGFELRAGEQPRWNCFRRAFWRNAHSWWLLRRFNPARWREIGFRQMQRCELWISREELMARYGE